MSDLSTEFPFKVLRRLAKNAKANDVVCIRAIEGEFTEDERLRLFARAQQALKDSESSTNRRLLQVLVRVLRHSVRALTHERRLDQQRTKQLWQADRHRIKLAKLAAWKLRIVGKAEISGYASPQSNFRWASKRKRRS